MNKYLASVRVGGTVVKTIVFADSATHARLIIQYQFGMSSIASGPNQTSESVEDYPLLDSLIKPKPPMTPAQTRINGLQQNVERSREQLKAERERQRQQRERRLQLKQNKPIL